MHELNPPDYNSPTHNDSFSEALTNGEMNRSRKQFCLSKNSLNKHAIVFVQYKNKNKNGKKEGGGTFVWHKYVTFLIPMICVQMAK